MCVRSDFRKVTIRPEFFQYFYIKQSDVDYLHTCGYDRRRIWEC